MIERGSPRGPLDRDIRKEPLNVGAQTIGFTDSGWWFDREPIFSLLQRINTNRLIQGKRPIELEVYTARRPELIARMGKALGMEKYLPPDVTPRYIQQLKRKYPLVVLSNVHAEFNATLGEELHRMTIGEDLLPPMAGASLTDRLKLGIMHRLYQAYWSLAQGPASRGRGVNLAAGLKDINLKNVPKNIPDELRPYFERLVGLTMHTNLIEYFAATGQLQAILEAVENTYAESERPYNSLYLQYLKSEGIGSRALAADPGTIRNKIVLPRGLSGMVLGEDHLAIRGEDPIRAYDIAADVIRIVHLAGMKGTTVHALIDPRQAGKGIKDTENFLKHISTCEHPGKLSVVYDFNPLKLRHIPPKEQLEILSALVDWTEGVLAGDDLSSDDLLVIINDILGRARQNRAQGLLVPAHT